MNRDFRFFIFLIVATALFLILTAPARPADTRSRPQLPPARYTQPPVDTTVPTRIFFWAAESDGAIQSTTRRLSFKHWYREQGSQAWLCQHILLYNPSCFYWDPQYRFDGCQIKARLNVRGIYEIVEIQRGDGTPIKPRSLREPEDDAPCYLE